MVQPIVVEAFDVVAVVVVVVVVVAVWVVVDELIVVVACFVLLCDRMPAGFRRLIEVLGVVGPLEIEEFRMTLEIEEFRMTSLVQVC